MTRRHIHHNPVEQRTVYVMDAIKFGEVFADLLASIPEEDVQLIRLIADGASLRRAAEILGIPRWRARRRISAALSRMRHPSRRGAIRPYLDEDIHQMLKYLERAAEHEAVDPNPLTWCDHHGWTEPLGLPRCGACPCELAPSASGLPEFGRPRRYCSDACRQRAYRRRRHGQTAEQAS